MIIVKISGGLGNQLFQYAFGEYASQVLNSEVYYDIKTNLVRNDFTQRSLLLNKLNINFNSASNYEISKVNKYYKGNLGRILRKISTFIPILTPNLKVENVSDEVLYDNKLKDNCYYDGYWQNYYYIQFVDKHISQKIALDNEIVFKYQSLIDEIENNMSVSIHIRRTDYITIKKNTKIFEICDLDYYNNAINYLESNYSNLVYYIFSDDINWAKNNFKDKKFRIISGNEAYVDLFLMSKCKHNIIANSTFSWWGAWLNKNPNKIIIAPQKWYKGKRNKKNEKLILKEWIQL